MRNRLGSWLRKHLKPKSSQITGVPTQNDAVKQHIAAMLYEWDPMDLRCSHVPDDEYSAEADHVLSALYRTNDAETLSREIDRILLYMFEEPAGKESMSFAQKLLKWKATASLGAQPSLKEHVTRIINEWDPAGLLRMGTREDVYSSEIEDALNALLQARDAKALAQEILQIFQRSIGAALHELRAFETAQKLITVRDLNR